MGLECHTQKEENNNAFVGIFERVGKWGFKIDFLSKNKRKLKSLHTHQHFQFWGKEEEENLNLVVIYVTKNPDKNTIYVHMCNKQGRELKKLQEKLLLYW